MTLNELILKLEQNVTVDNSSEKIISIGTMCGTDKDCEYIVHLENGTIIKL